MTFKFHARIRMILGFLVALGILSWTSVLLQREARQFRENRRWVTHTRDVLDGLQRFRNEVEETESAQRGYVLTGDHKYQEEFGSSADAARQSLERVLALTQDNQHQQYSIALLRPRLLAEIAALTKTIQLRREQGLEPALRAVAEGSAGRELDQIRLRTAEMQDEEKRLLANRTANYAASVATNETFLAMDVGVEFVLLSLGFLFIYRDHVNRVRFAVEIGNANNLLKAVVEGSGEGILAKNTEGRYQLINEAGARFVGKSTDEILGKTDLALFDLQSAERLSAEDREVLASGRMLAYERLLTTAAHSRIVASSKAPYRDGSGKIAGVVSVFRDVTERNHAEQELRETREAYRRLVEEGEGLICMHDLEGDLLSVNRAAAEILGYTPGSAGRVNLRQFLPPQDHPNFQTYLKEISKSGEHAGTMRILDRTGNIRYWSYRNRRVVEGHKPPYVVGHAQDITAQVRLEKALKASEEKLKVALESEKNLSRVDFLTNISNRRAFTEILQKEAARSRRYKRPLTLAYIDLDNFKQVNDQLGHELGDELLRLVAQTICANIRGTDTLARLGGDEFALLLPETGEEAANAVVAKLRNVLLATAQARQWPVTLSIGLATFAKPGESVEQIVKVADDLMYAAKNEGKNRIVNAYVEA
jgi:diguanylate cyclase (GGDEF)-like protein/PAS domain S-box-containing protein